MFSIENENSAGGEMFLIQTNRFSGKSVNWNMTQLELKRREKIIAYIQQADDQDLIDEIYRILDIEFDDSIYRTSEGQKLAIAEGESQIEAGLGISEVDADLEIDAWLRG